MVAVSLKKKKKNTTKKQRLTFKNTDNYYAGELIDKCGLKGLSYGGAKISEKHANFIINYNKASVNDVLQLIKIIKDKVFQRYKVQLETEVEIF